MKWLYYSLLIIGIWLLVILQTSYLTAWGNWGAVMHPVLWGLVYTSFFSKKNLWLVVIVGGFMLDVVGLSFGLNLIALVVVAFSLDIVHKYHLALRNLLSWLLTGIVAVISYMVAVFILNNSLGLAWQWLGVIDLSWERILMFIIMNLLALLVVFGLHNLWKYFTYGK